MESGKSKQSAPPAAPFARALLAWYGRHARDLPWRRNRDPYAIWVSEVMLQQTQVATVKGYFERFMTALPTIAALATVDEQAVLRLWEGLGYYRRARQLHQAAQVLVREHGGAFPRDREAVDRLPGIGRYTAGAILSIAFDAREPILEANTIRVFSRLVGYQGDAHSTAGQRLLWSIAEAVLPRRGCGRFNSALMELGSEVCSARSPQCEECPVAVWCQARAMGAQETIPAAKPKLRAELRREAAVLVLRGKKVLLVQCPQGQRWASLWDFPRFQVADDRSEATRQELVEQVRLQTGVSIELGEHQTTLKHGVTRFRITLDCYRARYRSAVSRAAVTIAWLRPEELDAYPLSTTGRKLSRLVTSG